MEVAGWLGQVKPSSRNSTWLTAWLTGRLVQWFLYPTSTLPLIKLFIWYATAMFTNPGWTCGWTQKAAEPILW